MDVRVILGIIITFGALMIGIGVVMLSKSDNTQLNVSSQSTVDSIKTQTSKQIEVPMTTPWTTTGIQVNSGQTLIVKASGKGVWKNIPASNPNAVPYPYEECSPDGTSPNSKDYLSNIDQYQTSLANKGALIGKIGNYGVPFKVGTQLNKSIKEDGILYLGINDMKPEINMGSWNDNAGSFSARIEIK